MNRLVAAAIGVVIAAGLAGCAQKKPESSGKPLPSASEMFDKKEVPKNARGAGPN